MTSLHIISVVPVEFFTKHNAMKIRRSFKRRIPTTDAPQRISKIANSLSDSRFDFFCLPKRSQSIEAFVAFEGTSGALVTIYSINDWAFDAAGVDEALKIRRARNRQAVGRDSNSDFTPWLEHITRASEARFGKVWPSYAFTFFCVTTEKPLSSEEATLARLMAEPSLIGNDDQQHESAKVALENLKPDALSHIDDCDVSILSNTFITWSTICSVIQSGPDYHWRETCDLLIALEVRLQIIWNRCYAMSCLAEQVFEEEKHLKDRDELYISFARTIDDARSVLSSRVSGRADRIFKALVETSQMASEITRLQGKLEVLARFIERQTSKHSRGYRRAVEFLLVLLASLTLIEALIGFPIFRFDNTVRPLIAGGTFLVIFTISAILIWLRPSE